MNYLSRFILIVISIFFIACSTSNKSDIVNSPHIEKRIKVVLITVDGTRWQDVLVGTDKHLYGKEIPSRELLPNFYHYLVDQGTLVGQKSPMVASNSSHVSLPGYLEIMRGYTTYDCYNNNCEPHLSTTIADYFDQVAVFSSWDKIRKVVSSNSDYMVVNCGRSYRTQPWLDKSFEDNQTFDGSAFSYDPLYRPDALTQQVALDYFRNVHPDFLWVALGDTDEWAHMGNYSNYISALQSADTFLGELMKDREASQYIVIVTVDHGRGSDWTSHGRDEESARVWLMMAGPHVSKNYQPSYTIPMTLANIMPTVLGLYNNEKYYNSFLLP